MSRIGKKPIPIPKGVTVKVLDGASRSRDRREVEAAVPGGINFELTDGISWPRRATDDPALGNITACAQPRGQRVPGVTDGFKRSSTSSVWVPRGGEGQAGHLRARGYSHAVVFDYPPASTSLIEKQTHLYRDRGRSPARRQVAAKSAVAEPDPYKQKGVRYHRRSAEEEGAAKPER
jgi:large subunit ribosomal protein L6